MNIHPNLIVQAQGGVEAAGDLADREMEFVCRRRAPLPEGGQRFLRPRDVSRLEHLAMHVDVPERDLKLDEICGLSIHGTFQA